MSDKALISELTYRTLESQRKDLAGLPTFIIPDDLPQLFRQTTRKDCDRFHVVSLGVIADTEKKFRDFLANAKRRKAVIVSVEDKQTFAVNGNCENLVKWWKVARVNGAAKIGADISAAIKKASTKEAIDKIKDRWPLPSKEWPTRVLLKEVGRSFKTVKKVLGVRLIAQTNYKAAQKRKARRQEAGRV